MKITTSKRFINCLILTTFCTVLFSSAKVEETEKYLSTKTVIKTIVIDAGHGGKDGATGGAIAKEKDVALQVALKLGKALEKSLPDVKVVYTRTTDVFLELYERIGIANKLKADLFISIHCNSMPTLQQRKVVKGTETWVAGFGTLKDQDNVLRENASILLENNYKDNYDGFDPNDPESYIIFSLMKSAFRNQSIKLASLVQDEYKASGRIDRGVKEQPLAVLRKAGMPAILTEIGFISQPQEEKYLASDNGQAEIVDNLLQAIINYKKDVES